MAEWWQEGADDAPVAVPRRDVVPDPGFSDPRDFTSSPELTSFIPEFRERRRKRAIGVTAIAALVIGWGVAILVKLHLEENQDLRRAGAMVFFLFSFIVAAIGLSLWFVWKWANERDPRDDPNRLRLY